MKKVLVAIDYNPSAEKVAKKGLELAIAMNAEALLLHVISDLNYYITDRYDPIMGFDGFMNQEYLLENPVQNLNQESENYLKSIKKHLKNESIKTVTLEGDAADSIIEYVEKEKIDYIVMGSHSKGFLEDIFMGSVTQKVLHHSTIPLLIVSTKK